MQGFRGHGKHHLLVRGTEANTALIVTHLFDDVNDVGKISVFFALFLWPPLCLLLASVIVKAQMLR